jgi:hypothetical protein
MRTIPKLETIEKYIRESTEHLNFMQNVINSYDDLKDIFKEKPEIANHFETEIENFHSIITLSQLEISLVLKSLYFAKNESEEKHITKRGLLVIYEIKIALDKLNPTLKKIRNDFPELEIEFKDILDIIKQAKKRISSERRIEEIRNNTSAHINSNFLEYYQFLEKIDLEEDISLIVRINLILNEINNFLFKVSLNQLNNNKSKQ